MGKRLASKNQRWLLQLLGCKIPDDLTAEEYHATVKALVDRNILTQEDLEKPWRRLPPSKNQLESLRLYNVTLPHNQMTRGRVSDYIGGKIAASMSAKASTPRQLEYLKEIGGLPDERMNEHEASQYIQWIQANHDSRECGSCEGSYPDYETKCPVCGEINSNPIKYPCPEDVFSASIMRKLGRLLGGLQFSIWGR